MARKRSLTPRTPITSITADRSARLYALLRLLGDGPKPRALLIRRLRLDVRGFYRDLQKLRAFGIGFDLDEHTYRLTDSFEAAISRLPFPDPQLNLHEAIILSRGKTPAHRKLRAQIEIITGKRSQATPN